MDTLHQIYFSLMKQMMSTLHEASDLNKDDSFLEIRFIFRYL